MHITSNMALRSWGSEQVLCSVVRAAEGKQQCCAHVPGAQYWLPLVGHLHSLQGTPPGAGGEQSVSWTLKDENNSSEEQQLPAKSKSLENEEEKRGICYGLHRQAAERDRVHLDCVGVSSKKEAS